MPLTHQHKPEVFDPGHCQDCARDAGLLDHYQHIQRQERAFRDTQSWARQARRYAIYSLSAAGVAILLAAVALLTG